MSFLSILPQAAIESAKRTRMLHKRFVIGSINQGNVQIGHSFSALEQNTLFFTDICTADDYLDEPSHNFEARGFLKSIGALCLQIVSIGNIDTQHRIAELAMDDRSKQRYKDATGFLFRGNDIGYLHQDPPIMTMSISTVLQPGNSIGVSYLSVMEPVGGGEYVLKHDYPIERTQGPRFEKIGDYERPQN